MYQKILTALGPWLTRMKNGNPRPKKFFGLADSQSPWPYYVIYIIPLVWLFSVWYGGIAYLISPIFFFVVLPLLELIRGSDGTNPAEEDYEKLQNDARFKWATWLWIVPQLFMIVFGAYVINNWHLSVFEKFFLSISTGLITGSIGINISHELMHRNNGMERSLAKGLLLTVLYSHFDIEHLFGHHVNVGTENDPATSRLGESLYSFWLRTIAHSYLSAWEISKRQKNIQIMFTYHAAQIAYLYIMFTIGGLTGVCFVVLQSIVAILLLETVNYIEHYGLTREPSEPVADMHSWNTDAFSTNFITFRLQRHSDHHSNARRRYPNLRNIPGTPELPTGYTGCVVLALFPDLWMSIMNHRVASVYVEKKYY